MEIIETKRDGALMQICMFMGNDHYINMCPQNGYPIYGYLNKGHLRQNPSSSLEFSWLNGVSSDIRFNSEANIDYIDYLKEVKPDYNNYVINKFPLKYKKSKITYKNLTDKKFEKLEKIQSDKYETIFTPERSLTEKNDPIIIPKYELIPLKT